MLRLRNDQMDALRRPAVEDFVDEMVLHLHEFFPEDCARIGVMAARELVVDGIRRAEGYGVVSPRGVCKYLNLMMIFSPDFDTNAETAPWVRPILTDEAVPDTTARMDILSEKAIAMLQAAEGATDESNDEIQEMRSP